jgi:hypothetical protein
VPPSFWKLAFFDVEPLLNGQDNNEVCVFPPDHPDSFSAFERGVDYQESGESGAFNDISFKTDDVKRVWPKQNS